MGRRRKARELALQCLYELESPGKDPDRVLDEHAARRRSAPASAEYARRLVAWARQEAAAADAAVAARVENWEPERLSLIVRLVLRLSLAEGRHAPEVPTRVILDEAVELARKYDSDEAARFVNGVLEPLLLAARGEGAP
ncbi:MAG: transcription antitermination factor NusB [Candidatus Krumholzibacteriota bacterium]|nr:transcription antitermination factor NusB [Candidatus Krumholzibacteriota bacterium]